MSQVITTDTRLHKYSYEGKKTKIKSLLKEGKYGLMTLLFFLIY